MLPSRQGHGEAKERVGFILCYFGYIEASIPGRPAQWAISSFAILVLPIGVGVGGRPPWDGGLHDGLLAQW